MAFTKKAWSAAKKYGYRSGLEKTVQQEMQNRGIAVEYETIKIEWEDLRYRKYTPDFLLPNGIIVETKGLFTPEDRRKHVLVRKQHPELDIRIVFENSKRRISKVSKTTYADWCVNHDILYADKMIPDEWIEEPSKQKPPKSVAYKGKKHGT